MESRASKNMKMKLFARFSIILAALLISLSLILAQNLTIVKSISKDSIYPGESLGVSINVTNNGASAITGTLYDLAPEFAEIEENEVQENISEGSSSMANDKSFSLNLLPHESASMSYNIIFTGVPEAFLNKSLNLGKSSFYDSEGNGFFSNSVVVFIKSDKALVCNYNYKCEEGENHLNCFQDCLSGYNDEYCDRLSDKRCDSDCSTFEDKDCVVEKIKSYKFYILMSTVLIILAVLGIIFWRKFRLKK